MAGHFEHQYVVVADLSGFHHREVPVDRTRERHEMLVPLSAIVVQVGCPQVSGQRFNGFGQIAHEMGVSVVEADPDVHAVQFVLDHDRRRVFRFAASQTPGARPFLARTGLGEAPGTIVFVERDGWSVRSTAAIRMARRLGFPWSLAVAALVLPAALRDVAYRVIARNRLRWFGRRDTCRIPTPDEASRFL